MIDIRAQCEEYQRTHPALRNVPLKQLMEELRAGCEKGGVPYISPEMSAQEAFIAKARKVHGDRYDYSKVEYTNSRTKVCIVCPGHGLFWQTPHSHLDGSGCPACPENRTLDTESFVTKARAKHGDHYDYGRVEYINNKTKVCIICPKHGEFWQAAGSHTRGNGCAKCSPTLRDDADSFIAKARAKHGDRYDYSKVEYVNSGTKVCIICPEHGEFWQAPRKHLSGRGCRACVGMGLGTDGFVAKARAAHGDRYDYSRTEYISPHEKVCVVCPEHGEFWQTPHAHRRGSGCPACGRVSRGLASPRQGQEAVKSAVPRGTADHVTRPTFAAGPSRSSRRR